MYALANSHKRSKLPVYGGTVKSSGHRRQKIKIYYKAAGIIDIADDFCEAGDVRGQWRRNRKTA